METFDILMTGLLSKIPKDENLQARDETFDFKIEFPTLFTVNQDKNEREKLAREQKLEEDAIMEKQQKVYQDFIGLHCGFRCG